jgi:hypothetical protein
MRNMISSFILTTFMTCSYAGALSLTLQPANLSVAERLRAQGVLTETLAQLPAKMHAALPLNLGIQFLQFEATNERAHLGEAKYFQNKILLNQEFLKPKASLIYSDKRFRQTLAHEIAHFYDKAVRVSDSAEFRTISGWRSGGNGLAQINNFERRLPDVYMHSKLSETFPTLFEYFLFDTDFQCRMPELARFFASHFELKLQAKCDSRMILYTSTGGADNSFREVDRQKIWAVDFLWASEGPGFASKFGHAMLRLVICAPNRVPGPDCYKDVQRHIVLSYAAASATGSFANFAGLAGKYPMNLYAIPFSTVLRQYNTTELRDLYAVPLKVSASQKDQLIDILYAHHWNLDGDYYFTTQNCATEVDRDLQAIGMIQDQSLPLNVPSELFDKILSTGLSSYPTKASLTRNPLLYFPSGQKTVDKALAIVGEQTHLKLKDIESYFEKINAPEISQLVKSCAPSPALYSLYYLEGIRKDRIHTALISQQVEKEAEQKETYLAAMEAGAKTMFSYRFAGSFLTSKSYGIPSYAEAKQVEILLQKSFTDVVEKLRGSAQAQEAQKILRSHFSQVVILQQRQVWILREAQLRDLKK